MQAESHEALVTCPECGAKISLADAAPETTLVYGGVDAPGYICPNCDRPFLVQRVTDRLRQVGQPYEEHATIPIRHPRPIHLRSVPEAEDTPRRGGG